MAEKTDKAGLKALREARKASIAKAQKAMKEQRSLIKRIKEQIKGEGKTVPQIASATGLPTDLILLYVTALRKYGMVAEGEKDGDYFKYKLMPEA